MSRGRISSAGAVLRALTIAAAFVIAPIASGVASAQGTDAPRAGPGGNTGQSSPGQPPAPSPPAAAPTNEAPAQIRIAPPAENTGQANPGGPPNPQTANPQTANPQTANPQTANPQTANPQPPNSPAQRPASREAPPAEAPQAAAPQPGDQPADAIQTQPRVALVIGNGDYQSLPALKTALNDAGLVAQTLKDLGFDVVDGGNMGQADFRRVVGDFLAKVQLAGPNTVAFVYVSGYGLQTEGENYLLPVDANIKREADIALQAFRMSDLTRALAGLPAAHRIVVLDVARKLEVVRTAQLPPGMIGIDPPVGMLVALNRAPGAVGDDLDASYMPYALSLVEMLRQQGMPIERVFEQVRLRVHQVSAGRDVPWEASKLQTPLILVPAPQADAPRPADAPVQPTATGPREPLNLLGAEEAYTVAIREDKITTYQEFLRAHPRDNNAKRVKVLLATARESECWRQTVRADTPRAYWTYRKRYPRGPHYWDADRRLVSLSAPVEAPPEFVEYVYELPPPIEYEVVEVTYDGVVGYEDVDLDPPPVFAPRYLAPAPIFFSRPLPAPRPAPLLGALPRPIAVPIPLPFFRQTNVPLGPNRPVFRPNFPGGPGVRLPGANNLPVIPGGPGRPPVIGRPPFPGQPPVIGRPPFPGRPPIGQPPIAGRPPFPGRPPVVDRPFPGRPPIVNRPGRPPIVDRPFPGRPPIVNRPGRPPIVDRPFPGRPPIVNRPGRPPIVNRPFPNRPPVVNRPFPGRPPIVNRPPVFRPPVVNRPPPVFRPNRPVVNRPPPVFRPPVANRPPVFRPQPGRPNRPGGFRF